MAARKAKIIIEEGNVYSHLFENGTKCYIQFVGKDHLRIDHDVVRVFSQRYREDENPPVEKIVSGEVDFFCYLRNLEYMVKSGWMKFVGRSDNVGMEQLSQITFFCGGRRIGQPARERWYMHSFRDDEWSYYGRIPKYSGNYVSSRGWTCEEFESRLTTGSWPLEPARVVLRDMLVEH